MFDGANHLLFELAKDLRRNMTDAEMVLWMHLKAGVGGLKFRRQHPIGIYIADFYCHKIKLIIEADGGIHDKEEIKQYDAERDRCLQEMGNTVLRFRNHDIMKNIEMVLDEINSKVEELKQGLINN